MTLGSSNKTWQKGISVIEQERRGDAYVNDPTDVAASSTDPAPSSLTTKLSPQQMKDLLTKREGLMRAGRVNDGGHQDTDQWRVYSHIIGCIERGELLRLMVQASAGHCSIINCLCLVFVVCCVSFQYSTRDGEIVLACLCVPLLLSLIHI